MYVNLHGDVAIKAMAGTGETGVVGTDDHLNLVKYGFIVLVFFVPTILLWKGMQSGDGLVLTSAFLVQYIGLIAERWFFFAQANHPQNLYYQTT